METYILVVFGLGVLFCFAGAWLLGAFTAAVFGNRTRKVGPWVYVHMPHLGAYHRIGPVFDGVRQLLQRHNPAWARQALGIYFDDSKVTPDRFCRSMAGFVIEGDVGDMVASCTCLV